MPCGRERPRSVPTIARSARAEVRFLNVREAILDEAIGRARPRGGPRRGTRLKTHLGDDNKPPSLHLRKARLHHVTHLNHLSPVVAPRWRCSCGSPSPLFFAAAAPHLGDAVGPTAPTAAAAAAADSQAGMPADLREAVERARYRISEPEQASGAASTER